jgi:hypothetical protein
MRHGFHKDGSASGLYAAAALPGVAPPFAIADVDVERREPRAGAMARLFDVLEIVRALAALFIPLVVLTATGSVEQKVDCGCVDDGVDWMV